MKIFRNIIMGAVCSLGFVACTDKLDSEYYYTFTGEMMSEYITSRPQYSDFATIAKRANMMDLLSTYGQYTCFLPDNDAFATYFAGKGIASVDSLTDEQCDTIARTHLVKYQYSTLDMSDGQALTNMNFRYIKIGHDLDEDSNAVVLLNSAAHIYLELQDDSVENGIVQPINMVLEHSNASVGDIMRENPQIGLFYQALVATGLRDSVQQLEDENYDSKGYPKYFYSQISGKRWLQCPIPRSSVTPSSSRLTRCWLKSTTLPRWKDWQPRPRNSMTRLIPKMPDCMTTITRIRRTR